MAPGVRIGALHLSISYEVTIGEGWVGILLDKALGGAAPDQKNDAQQSCYWFKACSQNHIGGCENSVVTQGPMLSGARHNAKSKRGL